MSRSGSFGAIPAGTARRRRRLTSVMFGKTSRVLWGQRRNTRRVTEIFGAPPHKTPCNGAGQRRCKIQSYADFASPVFIDIRPYPPLQLTVPAGGLVPGA